MSDLQLNSAGPFEAITKAFQGVSDAWRFLTLPAQADFVPSPETASASAESDDSEESPEKRHYLADVVWMHF